jgi:hypothetical protein
MQHVKAAGFVFFGLGLASMGCTPRATPFARSCGGEYIDGCMPYEYAQVVVGTFAPERIQPGDTLMRATLRATFETCGARTPAPPALQVSVVLGSAGSAVDARRDGGAFPMGQRVVPLGTYRNMSADPLVFEAVVTNPFDRTIPGNTELTLIFSPIVNTCEGQGLEVRYRTGPALP